jgi:uncharacterized membrane protein YhaH (DUF805 family)
MEIVRVINSALFHCLHFKGRSSRTEFCWFCGVFCVIIGLLMLGEQSLGSDHAWVAVTWKILVLIPLISMASRRLQDVGRSGWWLLQILPSAVVMNVLKDRVDPLSSVEMFVSTMAILLAFPVLYSLFLPGWDRNTDVNGR